MRRFYGVARSRSRERPTDVEGALWRAWKFCLDGGTTWHPAAGTTNWQYKWFANTGGTITLKSRATDDSLNIETPSAGVSVTVPNTQNPVPSLTSLSPNTANPGGPAFTLTVNGSNFISSSTIQWNGANLATTYVSATQLTTAIPASYIANASNATVTVFTPLPGGGTSNGLSFAVGAPFTIWGNTAPSAGAGWKDPSSLEVGVHFHADVSGYITGVRFYKWSFKPGTSADQ